MYRVLGDGFFSQILDTEKPYWAYVLLLVVTIIISIILIILAMKKVDKGIIITILCLSAIILGSTLMGGSCIVFAALLIKMRLDEVKENGV